MSSEDAKNFAIIDDKLVYDGSNINEQNWFNSTLSQNKGLKGVWYWNLDSQDKE